MSVRLELRRGLTCSVACGLAFCCLMPLAAAPPAVAATSVCATTTDPATPARPAAGAPCWTDVTPYPFGADGDPAGPASCHPTSAFSGEDTGCYLVVESMAFRAWNRGLAATTPASGATNPFGVWQFNGSRWFPDPTFPGRSVCAGDTVLWAGKLDYWLVGAAPDPFPPGHPRSLGVSWPRLCRFDGANFEWEPLDIPPATLARASYMTTPRPGGTSVTALKPGRITSGACVAWDDCMFFGDYGVVVHWDGTRLTDATPNLGAERWLATDYTSAVARTGGPGGPFAVAVGTSGGTDTNPVPASTPGALPAQPDGSPPPQLEAIRGGALAPIALEIPPAPLLTDLDPYRTDLVAVDIGADGRGWAAGNPVGAHIGSADDNLNLTGRRAQTGPPASPPSPLIPISASGPATGCTGPPESSFLFRPAGPGDSYKWAPALSVFPGSADALVGGQLLPHPSTPASRNGAQAEPVLVRTTCDGRYDATRFRAPDPTLEPGDALVPADAGATITSVAANAANDAWAATTPGALAQPAQIPQPYAQRPHLYRLTDGEPPAGPRGDDNESRPIDTTPDPPIFLDAPPEAPDEPPPPPPPAPLGIAPRHTPKPTIHAVVPSKPRRIGKDRYLLVVHFRVRTPIRIGLEALRGKRIVARTAIKLFKPGERRTLILTLSSKRWPTGLRFVKPTTKRVAADPPPSAGAQP